MGTARLEPRARPQRSEDVHERASASESWAQRAWSLVRVRSEARTCMSQWAERATGIEVADVDSAIGVPATALVRLGLRDNPRRLHLLVSQVLGKHVPTDPRIV